MPLRDYVCTECGTGFECLVRAPEDVPTKCPHCDGESLEQVITAMGGIKGNFGTVRKNNAGSYKRSKG